MWISRQAEKGEEAMSDDDAQDGQRARRDRVRRVLIEPLLDMGLRKRKGLTAEDQAAFLDRIERRLAYLGEGHLATLVEVVARNCEGPHRNLWPAEASIVAWASGLEPPPDEDSRLVRSYLGSAAGLRAWSEGPAVAMALRWWLREYGRPPRDCDWDAIRAKAVSLAGTRQRFEERRVEGTLTPDEAAWLERWAATLDRVRSAVLSRSEGAA